jgi:hypothetical protein
MKVQAPKAEQAINQQLLGPHQEEQLVQYIIRLTERDLPPIREMITYFARKVGKKEVGKGWDTQHFISHICYLAQPGREPSQIKVEDISNDCLLLRARELSAVWWSFSAERRSLGATRESAAINVKGSGSSVVASKFTGFNPFKCKLKSPFVLA